MKEMSIGYFPDIVIFLDIFTKIIKAIPRMEQLRRTFFCVNMA